MSRATEVLCPTKPHELDPKMRKQMNELVEKVAARAVIHNLGKDLLLLVWMAGFYHGAEAAWAQTEGQS